MLLGELLGNLVQNAIAYAGPGASITVVTRAHDGSVELVVEDDGPGIPVAARTRIFDRGARLDTGKPGTGLGLAIVRDVVEIYGGAVGLGTSEDLGGLMVTLRLPRAAA